MKILWAKSDFLHPTTKGGQIRTLETLKRLHRRHEIHYVALHSGEEEGVERASEYCTRVYPIPHRVPPRPSPRFWMQAGMGLLSPLPLAVSRYQSLAMKRRIEALLRSESFDAVVCDFLLAAPNIPDLAKATLFQHNVEATIWRRHAEQSASPVRRAYFQSQYRRMRRYEREVCRAAKNVVAVSPADASTIRSDYGAARVFDVPTGVDLDYFQPPAQARPGAELVFLGSMDWMPNVDGVEWFTREVLPLIRKHRPDCSFAIVGRRPPSRIRRLQDQDQRIEVTGTVDDVRPYLWGSAVSIVPLRIGGGTRLKIYESMAARIPVVSTTIGAEGLDVRDGVNIQIADAPHHFASHCLALLEDAGARRRISGAAWEMVAACYSWEVVSQRFEELLTWSNSSILERSIAS